MYSRDLVCDPQEQQKEWELCEGYPVGEAPPVHGDIELARLKPGQVIDLTCYAIKGQGREHAKWSPVSTASYRLLPEIRVDSEAVRGEVADQLVAKCPMGVFDIEDLGGGRRTAVAARPRDCTMCRECIREPEWDDRVQLLRKRDHFICECAAPPERAPARRSD